MRMEMGMIYGFHFIKWFFFGTSNSTLNNEICGPAGDTTLI